MPCPHTTLSQQPGKVLILLHLSTTDNRQPIHARPVSPHNAQDSFLHNTDTTNRPGICYSVMIGCRGVEHWLLSSKTLVAWTIKYFTLCKFHMVRILGGRGQEGGGEVEEGELERGECNMLALATYQVPDGAV